MNHIKELNRIFELQKANYSPANSPSYEVRMDRLNRLEEMIRTHMDDIISTLAKDFGTRNPDMAFLGDIYPTLAHVKYVKSQLKKWIKPERKSSGILALTGQKTYIVNEPLGVVGIMSPFNAPVSLAMDPAIEAIAGGNTVIMKLSESTPLTADLIQKLVSQYFKEEELAVITGEVDVSIAFVDRAWDKFFFTGGSEVGKKILAANAKYLTPAILELGGKTPCILLHDADVKSAAHKIAQVRMANAGQICISGDYVFLKENQLEAFITEAVNRMDELYPSLLDNPEFTAIINDREYNRITAYLEEAKEANCRIVYSNPKNEIVPDQKTRKIPFSIVVNPPRDLQVACREIFGPILTIFTYQDINEAITFINNNEKPLALYVFGKNREEINKVIRNTSSGGVTVNDLMMHVNSHKMGFGGVGYSGMGRYKGGKKGFHAFTNPKSVLEQGLMGKFTARFFIPYTSERARNMIRSTVGIKS